MASTSEIKRRIKAVASTNQITKAMEMVSASKMRKSQEIALLSRPYSLEILRILSFLQTKSSYVPDIMKARPIKKSVALIVSSDKGLAGSFNSNVIKLFEKNILEKIDSIGDCEYVAVGRKAEEFLQRKKISIAKSFKNFGDYVDIEQTQELSDFLLKGFVNKDWDRIVTISTQFRSTLKQEVIKRELLPASIESIWNSVQQLAPETGRYSGFVEMVTSTGIDLNRAENFDYLIEPSPKEIIDSLVPRILEILIYDIILETNASEHSARMVAMKNASENAQKLKDELVLKFNKIRQASITQEISEIVGGVEALQK